MWRLARLKRMIGSRDMVISSLGVVWCSNTKFTLGLHEMVYVPMNKFILGLHAWAQHETLYKLSAN